MNFIYSFTLTGPSNHVPQPSNVLPPPYTLPPSHRGIPQSVINRLDQYGLADLDLRGMMEWVDFEDWEIRLEERGVSRSDAAKIARALRGRYRGP